MIEKIFLSIVTLVVGIVLALLFLIFKSAWSMGNRMKEKDEHEEEGI